MCNFLCAGRNCGGVLPGCVRCRWTPAAPPSSASTPVGANATAGAVAVAEGAALPLCIKCVRLIVAESRECVDDCPLGYKEVWSARVDYMGRMCSGKLTPTLSMLLHLESLIQGKFCKFI